MPSSKTTRTYLVTGGSGFIGAAVVRRLIEAGHAVRVFDDNSRGRMRRLEPVAGRFEMVEGDVRDAGAVTDAVAGTDGVVHLAYINGTRFFYERPDEVLDVGVKGMINVIDACRAHGVGELIAASSSEVYQTPPLVPTPEDVPLVVPDVLNPRYSYGGGKILTELMALNHGRRHFEHVVVFRPHNVYGPDMGFEHVLPEFVLRMKRLAEETPEGVIRFPIQGTGSETRAFTWIEDFADGFMTCLEKGEHLGVYHVGAPHEIAIKDIVALVAAQFGREAEPVPGPEAPGATPRRCPDIAKLAALGFDPKTPLADGVARLARWYIEHADEAPAA